MKEKYTKLEKKIIKYLILNDNMLNIDVVIKEIYRYETVTQHEIENIRQLLVRLNKKIQQSIKARIICLEKENYIILILF